MAIPIYPRKENPSLGKEFREEFGSRERISQVPLGTLGLKGPAIELSPS